MHSFRALLLKHGYSLLFAYVFGVTAGVPVPADPMMVIMGALSADHHASVLLSLLTAAAAVLSADCIWYTIGRFRGRSVLGLLCRLSLEPDSCIRTTEARFQKRGAGALIFAKFLPGMSLVSTPLAGVIRMPIWRFLLADATGALLWGSAWLTTGLIFHRQVDKVILLIGLFGRRAGLTVLLAIALYVGYKFFQRWLFLRQIRINRITPQEVRTLIDVGVPLTIVDLRHPSDVEREGFKLPGALVLAPEDLRSRAHEIPDGQEIILYCT